MLFYLLVFCGKEQEAEYCVSSLVWVVYIGIYKICCNICVYWLKMCLLNENVSTEWKDAYWPKKCILNENVLTKRCLLTCHNPLYWIYQKVPIDRKCAYWLKMCILAENVSIE